MISARLNVLRGYRVEEKSTRNRMAEIKPVTSLFFINQFNIRARLKSI